MRAADFLHDLRSMGRAKISSSTQRTKKNTCAVHDSPVNARPTSVAGKEMPRKHQAEHADQTMRSPNEGSQSEGHTKPRRGRERAAKRWGQIDRMELDALLEQAAEDENRAANLRLDAISQVCAALLEGCRISCDTYVAGRLSLPNEPLRFGCTRKRDGRVVEVFQSFDEGNIDDRGPYAIALRERDWSVFAAARAFVENVGADVALAAVRDRHRPQKNIPRARPSEVSVSP